MVSRWIDANVVSWRSSIILLAPMGLWGMLWLSIGTGEGNIKGIVAPDTPRQFIDGIRSVFPFAAAAAALAIIFFGIKGRRPPGVLFFGPMGLAAVYGAVGVISSIVSVDQPQALYWSLAYLSVPFVLWSLVWRREMVSYLGLLVDYTGTVVVLIVAALFIVSLANFDLGSSLLNPARLAECNSAIPGDYARLTSGVLRSTGVGRYAAIGAIVAMAALWRSDRKALWGIVLLASLSLLIFSGARSAYLGFALAGPFTALALWGEKVVVAVAVVAVLSVPVFWATGIHQTFLDNCVFRQAPGAPSTQTIPAQPTQESDGKLLGYIPSAFFKFTGRTAVWDQGWDLFLESPVLGYGFNADRILLNTHMHNAFMHALVQTGTLGTLPFVAALILGWFLLGRAMLNLGRFSTVRKSLTIQAGGILIFLTFRGISESSGAFFGIGWLLLAPMLFYLQIVNKPEAGLRKQ